MNVLEISGLKKSFGEKKVLQGVELTVPEKKVFGFVGRNGAGKTTTMKVTLGLLAADAGEVRVCGEPVHYGNTKTNRFIGYLPDVPEYYSFMTAMEYLNFCGEITGLPSGEIKGRCEEMLRLVGLADEKHRIKGFSRGMKQRLGIAQALLGRPKLLICDEPTSALDPLGRKEILDVLVAAKEETTILFSTHVLSDVEHICDEMALLNDGRIVMQGSIEEVKSKRRSNAVEIQMERAEDAQTLAGTFSGFQVVKPEVLLLKDAAKVSDVLRFLADHEMPFVRMEKQEATLEDVFMEVLKSGSLAADVEGREGKA
ncbi:MAG: ABC transporter ATP-binding protein [Lachnospiraceae bacterium]|nr:ABC transporter ATP-binding protein [Lachnospiraceae bacterium]